MSSTISLIVGLMIVFAFGAFLNKLAVFIGSKSFIISEITKFTLKLIHKAGSN